MLIDTHCHLYDSAYESDREAVIARARTAGVTRIVIPATDLDSGEAGIALAAGHDGIFASVGLHPNDLSGFNADRIAQIAEQSTRAKVVAVGEIGLDYHWDISPKALQHQAFEAQLALAATLQLPVIIHNREASEDVIAILRAWVPTLPETLRERPGVLHSFSAPGVIADEAIRLGFYLGFTGPLTYKNADELRTIAARIPLDRILVETDGPYLAPQQFRGKRNEPAYVHQVTDRLAGLRGLSIAEIETVTTANAARLFGI